MTLLLLLQIAMKSISIMRYLTDHLDDLLLGLSARLTVVHDVPVLLAQLLESRPWMRKGQVFEGTDWIPDDEYTLPKLEAQSWIAIYNILSKKCCNDKYQLHHYRLGVLNKLSGRINDNLILQLPILEKFKAWLLHIGMVKSQSESAKDMMLIESIAELQVSLEKRYANHYAEIALAQKDTFLSEAEQGTWQTEAASQLLETLDSEAVRSLLKEPNATSCGYCHQPEASQRCSRCKRVRYCSRDCQSSDWPRHRSRCDVSKK